MTIPRELAITYGTYVVAQPTGKFRITNGYDRGRFEFECVIRSGSAADLESDCDDLEDAFRKPRQDLTVTMGGADVILWKQSDNTGFDANPVARKVGHDWDSGRARLYSVTIDVGLPADNLSLDGRRESTIDVSYDAARRRSVRIYGVYTALAANAATAQYAAAIQAYATAVLTALGGSYRRVAEEQEYLETDKELRFDLTYQEIVAAQADALDSEPTATTFNQKLLDQSFRVQVQSTLPPQTKNTGRGSPLPLLDVRVEYSASVNVEQLAPGQDITSQTTTIRAWILGRVQSIVSAAGLALVEDEPDYDFDASTIRLRQLYRVAAASNWLEYKRVDETAYRVGETLVPVWTRNPWSRHRYQGPSQLVYSIKETGLWRGHTGLVRELDILGKAAPILPLPLSADEWIHIDTNVNQWKRTEGLFSVELETTQFERTTRYEAAKIERQRVVT